MAMQTCAALRKFDARSEAASSKFRLLGRHCCNAAGQAAEKGPDDLAILEMAETPIMPPLLDNECQACGKR
jgi:hypothetical protein